MRRIFLNIGYERQVRAQFLTLGAPSALKRANGRGFVTCASERALPSIATAPAPRRWGHSGALAIERLNPRACARARLLKVNTLVPSARPFSTKTLVECQTLSQSRQCNSISAVRVVPLMSIFQQSKSTSTSALPPVTIGGMLKGPGMRAQ